MKKKTVKIGLFDSGIGGLDLVRSIFELWTKERHWSEYPLHFTYISDLAFCPYGTKNPEEIRQRVLYLANELLLQGVDLIVVACNTATAYGISSLRKELPHIPIVGVEPYLNFIYQYLSHTCSLQQPEQYFHPIVLLTPAMAKAQRYEKLKKNLFHSLNMSNLSFNDHQLLSIPCPGLADFIEFESFQLTMEGILHFLKHYFSSHGPISSYGHVTHAILGCTHYPLIQKQLSDVLQCECISPSPAVAKRVFQLISTERPVLNIATPTPSLLSFQSHLSFESVGPLLQVATTLVDPLMEKKMNHILPPHFKHPSGHSL